jgi:AcrR family transcriptional regulator
MPPTPTITDEALLGRLLEVFRTYGFEGTTLSRLRAATGLERSSLYHRFPGGKAEMALRVLEHTDRCFAADVFASLAAPGSPRDRAVGVARGIRRFYDRGLRWCVLDTLSLGEPAPAVRLHLQRTVDRFLAALAGLAEEAGCLPGEAASRAGRALVMLEGALVVSRASGNPAAFRRVLKELPDLLTG